MPFRRRFLALGAVTALAGCTTTADDLPKSGSSQSIDPDRQIYGADGEWSSFSCNASNTRTVADGRAPVDGVTERWRVEVPQTTYREPLVADGRVFVPTPSAFVVYDATDGMELWRKDDENSADVSATPLVRDGIVFASNSDRLLALDAKTGETRWKKTFDGDGRVRTPSMNMNRLYVPVGDRIYGLDSVTGEVAWSRRLFGTVLGSPPIYTGMLVTLVTEAGKLYLFDDDGTGWGEWNLPSRPQMSPTADTDGIYVNCLDGKTYGITLDSAPRFDTDWKVRTGWANEGLGVKTHLYATGTGGLHAIDPENGERSWKHDTGSWRWTAPAIGRDTLFVGGNKLYAFDPTPSFRIPGTGPVLNDGTLYVVAQTAERNYHLLALE